MHFDGTHPISPQCLISSLPFLYSSILILNQLTTSILETLESLEGFRLCKVGKSRLCLGRAHQRLVEDLEDFHWKAHNALYKDELELLHILYNRIKQSDHTSDSDGSLFRTFSYLNLMRS